MTQTVSPPSTAFDTLNAQAPIVLAFPVDPLPAPEVVASLRQLALEHDLARKLFVLLAAKKRNRAFETMDSWSRMLGADNASVVKLAKLLEAIEVGHFARGWRSASRFEWRHARTAVARLALGLAADADRKQ